MLSSPELIKKKEEEQKLNHHDSNFNFSILSKNNIETESLSSIETHTKTHKENEDDKFKIPKLRRNHTSILIGTNIFLYGGISQEGIYLNDCWILNLKNLSWSLLEFTGRMPPSLAYHCSCLALEKEQLDNPNLSIYKVPISQRKTVPLLKCDGVFFLVE
jgi:hypothetical protein